MRVCRDALAAARGGSQEPQALCVGDPSPLSVDEQIELIGAAVRAAAGPQREWAVAGLFEVAMTEDPRFRPAVLEALEASGALSPESVALVPTWSDADARIVDLLRGSVPDDAQLPSPAACDLSTDSPEGPLRLSCSGGHCLDGSCVSAEFAIRARGWRLERVRVYETR